MDKDEILKRFKEYEVDTSNSGDYIKRLRMSLGMSRKEFCEYTGIPYRTLQDWELDNRSMPPYVLRLLTYAILYEVLPKSDDKK